MHVKCNFANYRVLFSVTRVTRCTRSHSRLAPGFRTLNSIAHHHIHCHNIRHQGQSSALGPQEATCAQSGARFHSHAFLARVAASACQPAHASEE